MEPYNHYIVPTLLTSSGAVCEKGPTKKLAEFVNLMHNFAATIVLTVHTLHTSPGAIT
jgi:hypothetical protein